MDSGGRGKELPWVSHGQTHHTPKLSPPTKSVAHLSKHMEETTENTGGDGRGETSPKNQTKQPPKKPNPRENSRYNRGNALEKEEREE